jgi:hypothetical protein
MWPFNRKKQTKHIWTEREIALYERQMIARESLGKNYICHPSRDVQRKDAVYQQEYMAEQPVQVTRRLWVIK